MNELFGDETSIHKEIKKYIKNNMMLRLEDIVVEMLLLLGEEHPITYIHIP